MEPHAADIKRLGKKKVAQIRLSNALANALLGELRASIPSLTPHAAAGEIWVTGALRSAQVDLVEFHPQDGLRLAVELKPVNLAAGRAIWNRSGDVRVTARTASGCRCILDSSCCVLAVTGAEPLLA